MPQFLIIGFGNSLRGDDGAGVVAAERLAEVVPVDRAMVLACHQLLPELAEDVSRARRVVFLDASCQLPPGQVCSTPLLPLPAAAAGRDASATGAAPPPGSGLDLGHHLTPAAVLVLARSLYGREPEQAVLLTVGVASMDLGEGLSPAVARGVDEMVARVLAWLA